MLGPDPNRELLKDSTRLAAFLQECLALGSLRGFKHFESFVRGREELVLCIYTNNYTPKPSALMPKDVLGKYYTRNKLSQWQSPESQSPLDEDFRQLRSHHEQLIRAQPGHIEEDDNPLQLQKTNEWKISNVSLWEMVAEIVTMTSNPKNPFQLDFDYIDKLPIEESVLLTGSLLAFLESVWIQANPSIAFLDDVHAEIQVLQSKHIENMYAYSLKNKN
ncbi:hypothetical protein MUCCIDRAFT_112432 [Mucor lusitanicus CBS 277.49]|uniref:DUF7886 domain-containing protein n=1 Tax=Mucor lusitanicus CBS 277.49 TaxID=747725 RepID=A0A168JBX2_MUCCL|nr:hypothetical protein MUCCIDRAFT_112432 [Mucor lusitanicus CBS 277.49]